MKKLDAEKELKEFEVLKDPYTQDKLKQNIPLKEKLEDLKQAYTDDLTGLKNYAFYRAYLDPEGKLTIEELGRVNKPMTVIELDDFKQIKDTFGRYAGYKVVQAFAEIANKVAPGKVIRKCDDEFVIFLERPLEEQKAIIQKIREEFKKKTFYFKIISGPNKGKEVKVTGLNFTTGPGHNFKTADELIYKLKKEGKKGGDINEWESEMGHNVLRVPGGRGTGRQQDNREGESVLRPDSLQSQAGLGTQSSADTTRNESPSEKNISLDEGSGNIRPSGLSAGEQGKPGEQVSGAGLPPNQPKL
jgi:diguanylate cyclase (GGDEF)-like protein